MPRHLLLTALLTAAAAGGEPGAPFRMPPREKPELLGAKLGFRGPTALAFDSRNRPWMLNTRDPAAYGTIMTIRGGEWVRIPYLDALRKAFPWAGPPAERYWHAPGSITIDDDDAVYAVVPLWRDGRKRGLGLLYAPGPGEGFRSYAIPGLKVLEVRTGHNDLSAPPAVALLTYRTPHPAKWTAYHDLSVLFPRKTGDGLALGEPVHITADCFGMSLHSGGCSFAVTQGRKTHVVYAEIPRDGKGGNPTYVTTVDRDARKVVCRTRLAVAAPKTPDVHATPVIAACGKGFLHVICGAHNNPFLYGKSLKPGDASGWTRPAEMFDGQTYATLVVDPGSRLHTVYRRHPRLLYGSRGGDGPWDGPRVLVREPKGYRGYTIYYHRLFIDRAGALYLSFTFYEHRSGKKWRTPTVLAVSEDRGTRWRLASKETFLRRMKDGGGKCY